VIAQISPEQQSLLDAMDDGRFRMRYVGFLLMTCFGTPSTGVRAELLADIIDMGKHGLLCGVGVSFADSVINGLMLT
jgi:hypothetical protein